MSINQIKLPKGTIQSLYKNHLVKSNTPHNPCTSKDSEKELSVLGNNKKNITILINEPDVVYINETSLSFLTGILTACKLGLEDVSIVNMKYNNDPSYQKITESLQSKVILLFGVEPANISLPISFPAYQIQRFNNQTYLYTKSLEALKGNKDEKTKLWNCLKSIFEII